MPTNKREKSKSQTEEYKLLRLEVEKEWSLPYDKDRRYVILKRAVTFLVCNAIAFWYEDDSREKMEDWLISRLNIQRLANEVNKCLFKDKSFEEYEDLYMQVKEYSEKGYVKYFDRYTIDTCDGLYNTLINGYWVPESGAWIIKSNGSIAAFLKFPPSEERVRKVSTILRKKAAV